MRSKILKILNDNTTTLKSGTNGDTYPEKCIHSDDFVHIADEIHKLYQSKKRE